MKTEINESKHTETGKLVSAQGLTQADFWPEDARPSVRQVVEWSYQRRIPSIKIGRKRLFDLDAVRDHLTKKLAVNARGAA